MLSCDWAAIKLSSLPDCLADSLVCHRIQPAVHRLWRKVGGEYDDYIINPKRSGYQSLHTAVMGPGGVPIEVQIRTAQMHEQAEYGDAAHWAYKENTPKLAAPGKVQVCMLSMRCDWHCINCVGVLKLI